MSLNSLKVRTALTLKPNNAPTNPENGDVYYDSTSNQFFFYQNGAWVNYLTVGGGTLGVASGGTGNATLTPYGLLTGGTTSTGALQQVPGATAGYVLTSNGTTAAPTFQAPAAGSYTAPTTSVAYSTGIGTGGFAVSPSSYGYVFTDTAVSAVAGDVYQSSATVTITNASPAVITAPVAHNLQVNMPVTFATTGALPTGLVAATTYYVSSVPSTTTFQVSAYVTGPSINTSSAGSGTQTLLYGSFTVASNTSASPMLKTTSPTLANIAPTPSTATVATSTVVPIPPPVSGTLARVSGTGPATVTFSNAQFYNSGYAGTVFTITAATASAADVYQDQKTVTITIAAPGVVTTSVAHGLLVGTAVTFSTTGALPTGITAGTTYYVSSVPSVTTFQISTTSGGSSLTTTGTQSGTQTVNMNSFTVATGGGISGFTTLFTTQASGFQPGISGTLTKISGAGGSSATITYSASQPLATYTLPTTPRTPLYIQTDFCGGGGGGSGGLSGGTGGTGGTTFFGTALIAANGGAGGQDAANASIGGTVVTTGTGYTALVTQRGSGGGPGNSINTNVVDAQGGNGGASPYGGAGAGSISQNAGATAAGPNSGSGGGGAGGGAGATASGAGGSAGGYFSGIITSLSTSYLYAVGIGGAGGTNGGQAGGSGIIIIKELYQ